MERYKESLKPLNDKIENFGSSLTSDERVTYIYIYVYIYIYIYIYIYAYIYVYKSTGDIIKGYCFISILHPTVRGLHIVRTRTCAYPHMSDTDVRLVGMLFQHDSIPSTLICSFIGFNQF
jgi:hypothetical protein